MARPVNKLVHAANAPQSRATKVAKTSRIVRIARRLGRRIPAGEVRALPKDFSDQLDHYIYGTPKR